MSESPRVVTEIKDQIAFVTLSRADKLNALDYPMFEQLAKAARALKKNKQIRAVIVSGAGKAFCSGLDVKNMFSQPINMLKLLIKPGLKAANLVQEVSMLWREIPVPVIAVTHGKCWGGGFQIALGADFRFSSQDCTFAVMEAKWGLIPDMGASVLLRELMPIDVAKELTMTARIITADEAKSLHLVTRVCVDPMQEAIDFAEEIIQKSPDAIASAKTLYQETWFSSIRNALDWETKLQRKLIGRYNQRAAISRGTPSKDNAKEVMPFKDRR